MIDHRADVLIVYLLLCVLLNINVPWTRLFPKGNMNLVVCTDIPLLMIYLSVTGVGMYLSVSVVIEFLCYVTITFKRSELEDYIWW